MGTNHHQRFRCLLCPDSAVFDNESNNLHQDHPKQSLISDDQLLAKFGTKVNEPGHHEINVFDCPYCDRQRLSISTLYDHLTLEHLDVPFSVRCPVCVCFRAGHASILDGEHLTKHLREQHGSTEEQYRQHEMIYQMYAADERELLRFIASTLPPTYGGNWRPSKNEHDEASSQSKTCSICLDQFLEHNHRELACQHKFHVECIDTWTAQNDTCPVCRRCVQR